MSDKSFHNIIKQLNTTGQSLNIEPEEKEHIKNELISNIRIQHALSPYLSGLFNKTQNLDRIFEKMKKSS
ncbi:MAG: hypothetical protein LWY06_19810 [Firmicutes bacterium]|nr:hypothetical protein [Bacillota bacterium]